MIPLIKSRFYQTESSLSGLKAKLKVIDKLAMRNNPKRNDSESQKDGDHKKVSANRLL